ACKGLKWQLFEIPKEEEEGAGADGSFACSTDGPDTSEQPLNPSNSRFDNPPQWQRARATWGSIAVLFVELLALCCILANNTVIEYEQSLMNAFPNTTTHEFLYL
ncbi:hypothetical protein HAX54_026006, partial [Datura stramonium]|nr:hypothetical protein [Datura stramonium]